MKTMKIFGLIALFFLTSNNVFSLDEIKGGILEGRVNGKDEDYNSYILFGKTEDTLFFTSSRPVQSSGPKKAMNAEMFYCTRPSSMRLAGESPNAGWSESKQIHIHNETMKGFTRGSQSVNEDRIIFAAERVISNDSTIGTSFLLDLWEMVKTEDGFTSPSPLGAVNDPDAWDSQPALSGDSKVLYFVSNRKGGSGGLDIWYSIRDAQGVWSSAKPVPNINTAGDEVSPCCGADGNFYFSSNWDFINKSKKKDKDIFRANYMSFSGLDLPANPVNLDIALKNDAKKYGLQIPTSISYNSEFDDEFPFISIDRKTIYLTSNRKSDFGKRDLYAFSLPKSRILLLVNVSEQIFDADGNLTVPPTPKFGLEMTLQDSASGSSQKIYSGEKIEVDADKTYLVKFSTFVQDECYKNIIEDKSVTKDNVVKTIKPFGMDTLFLKEFLISRRKVEIQPIIFKATEKLPFFITGYWYPNTSGNLNEFRKRESSGFFDESGFVDSSDYDYELASKIIDQIFEEKIYKPLEKVLPLFQFLCRDTLYLKATVHGFTDPRGLSGGEDHVYRPKSKGKHNYNDEPVTVGIDENGDAVTISKGIDMWKQGWPINPEKRNGSWIKLPNEGENGNVILSKLRAFYTFKTFDDMMATRSVIYKELRENGRILLDAEGYGIDKIGYETRKLKDDPESRRIEIYLDILRPEELNSHKRNMGGELLINNEKVKNGFKNEPVNVPKKTETTETATKKETKTEVKIEQTEETKPITKEEKKIEKKEETKSVAKVETKPDSKPEIKSETKSNVTPVVTSCYTIQYITYSEERDANNALEILKKNNIPDPNIMIYIDVIGNMSYRVRSGCFETAEEAVASMNEHKFVHKLLNLTKSPIIVKQ